MQKAHQAANTSQYLVHHQHIGILETKKRKQQDGTFLPAGTAYMVELTTMGLCRTVTSEDMLKAS